jgi:hypothetical protein
MHPMPKQNEFSDGSTDEPIPPLLKAYIDRQVQESYKQNPDTRKRFKNSWKSASPITKGSFIMTLFIAAATIAYAAIAWRQLAKMSETNRITQAALDRANQNSSDTSDQFQAQLRHFDAGLGQTKILAQQAATQSAQTTKLATDTHTLAIEARIQAETNRKSEVLMEAELLPNIVVQRMDVLEPIVAGVRTKVTNSFINSGGSVAYDIRTLSRNDTVIDGSGPKFEFRSFTGSKANIASKGTYDVQLFIGPQTPAQVEQIKLGVRKVYMTGEIIYTDFAHRVHHTFYCMEMDPASGNMNGCGAQRPPDD